MVDLEVDIAILGAGMGGLGCALALAKKGFKHISVYETASNLGFVGAGIQMPPNVGRILDRLGCWDEIYKEATNVKETSIRQGSTNAELAHVDMPDIEQKYGHAHLTGHRSSLAGGLHNGCKKHSDAITFHFATSLISVEAFEPKPVFTVQERNGPTRQVTADVLIGADGIKSKTRAAMLAELKYEHEEADTGQAAYRVMLKREQMAGDPEMIALLDSDCVTRWIGEKRHWIGYPVSRHQVYNLSSTQPDVNFADGVSAQYTTKGSKKQMLQVYDDFNPLVLKMLDLVPEGEVCEWKLRQHKPLRTWTVGSVALLGDACHPTLPHLSQGAAMAIEDGAVVAEVLSRLPDTTPSTIHRGLLTYEKLRKERTTALVELAAYSGRQLHLGDGAAKEERDKQFAAHKDTRGAIPDKWASPDVQKMIYEHDCMEVAADKCEDLFAGTAGTNGHVTNGGT